MRIILLFIWMSIGKISRIEVNCFIKIMNDQYGYLLYIHIYHFETLKILLSEFKCHYRCSTSVIPGIFSSFIVFI